MILDAQPSAHPAETGSGDLSAPLYVAWQLTNECNLACLHCLEESGPGKAFKDELSRAEIIKILEQLAAAEVPYLAFSGGEPMLHPHFFELVELVCRYGIDLKIETNGQYLTREKAERLRELGVKAVQVSLDGTTPEAFNRLRPRADFSKTITGLKNLQQADVPLEINFSPTQFNVEQIGEAVDLAYSFGAFSFYTGRTMYTGNAIKTWPKLTPSDEQYNKYFKILRAKEKEYEGRLRVYFHELDVFSELEYRLDHPAALIIILPNGLVKLINVLPFVCGDLRQDSLEKVWQNFQTAWQDPQVRTFVKKMIKDPSLASQLHQWIYL